MAKAIAVRPIVARHWLLWTFGPLGALLLMAAALRLILPRWVQGSGARLAS